MKKPIRKILMLSLAGLCLILAAIGLVLPVMPSLIFLIVALCILARELESARRAIAWARRRWPWLSQRIERARGHRWAPRHLHEFADDTHPDRPASPARVRRLRK